MQPYTKPVHFNALNGLFVLSLGNTQIDFSTHNVKWTLWGWGVLGVDVID